MQSYGSYKSDAALAFGFRLAVYLVIAGALALVVAGCAKDGPQGGRFSTTASGEYQQLSAGGSIDQTRNQLPIKGTDEKSDSSLTQSSK